MDNSLQSGRASINQAVEEIKTNLDGVSQSVSRLFGRGKEVATEQLDSSREAVVGYARENPLRSIGLAALVGVALGIVFFRR
jgi:ElaB/YqjD/DUF883 family membrane-anchored ribosome-binding protein